MQAIVTKYHGPGNRLGSRVSATAAAGRIYCEWNNALGIEDDHKAAAAAFVAKYQWAGTWAMGCLPSGDWVHVNTEA